MIHLFFLCMDFVVLAAIYRSRAQLLEVICSQFCIKSIIYKCINIQYRAQGLMAFSHSELLSYKCLPGVQKMLKT